MQANFQVFFNLSEQLPTAVTYFLLCFEVFLGQTIGSIVYLLAGGTIRTGELVKATKDLTQISVAPNLVSSTPAYVICTWP